MADVKQIITTRTKGKRTYTYAMDSVSQAVSVLSDYMAVSGSTPGEIEAAVSQLKADGVYTGIGGTWRIEAVDNADGLERWIRISEGLAGTDPHYLNRVRAEDIARVQTSLPPDRGARADLVTARLTILRAIDGHDDADLPAAAAMIARVIDTL